MPNGLSVRFVKQYDIEADSRGSKIEDWDYAIHLAITDQRPDVPFAQKYHDAWTFVQEQRNKPTT